MTMKFVRLRILIPLLLIILIVGGAGAAYLILINPGSIFVSWAEAAFPRRITMITFGPYPQESDLKRFRLAGGKYVVSLLDPRLPYEKELLDRETEEAQHLGLIVKDFPMASIFDRKVFQDYAVEEQKAVQFLRKLDGPAYVHCYLGKHRVIHVRDGLIAAGVPSRYWTPTGSNKEYWDVVTRLAKARDLFAQDEFAKVIEILQPITVTDPDVCNLRGWSNYRLGLITEAAQNFQDGLTVEPQNPRNLEGLGYCYLRQGEPVMAQREFDLVLARSPDDEGVLVGEGLAFLALQNKQAAAQIFRKVLGMDPSNAEAAGYLKRAESE
jgi:tetratricopeptide (TPR) repeat protein